MKRTASPTQSSSRIVLDDNSVHLAMTYYPHTPSLSHSSSLTHQRSSRTFQDARSTTDVLTSLITFYRDEQYWIHRARTAISLDRNPPRTRHSDPSSSLNNDIRGSDFTTSRSTVYPSPTRHGTSTSRRRYNDLEKLVLPADVDRMDVDGVPEPPERGRLHNDLTNGGMAHEDPGAQGPELAPPSFELRMRILQTYSDLVDARMESCLRLSRVVERREPMYR